MTNINWQPDVTVAAICEQDGKFLLVEEMAKSTGKVVYNQPAGHIEDGESLIQAVIRETREETCRLFTPEALLGLYRFRIDSHKTYIRYAFIGKADEINPALELDPDIRNTHWLTIEQIRTHKQLRSPLVLRCFEDYLSGQHYSLDLIKELNEIC